MLCLDRIAHDDGLAIDNDAPFIGLIHAGEHLHQSRFAGAVLPHERVDLTGKHAEIDPVERTHAGESLHYAFQAQNRLRFTHIRNSPSPLRFNCLSRNSTAIRITPRVTST